jgi:hypothetical protein
MPNKKCMYEGCDAPEYRKTGYCIRHKETGPRSIFIDTSKLVNEETNDDIEEIKEEEEEEVQVETEKESRKGDTKSKRKTKGKKKVEVQSQIILPVKPDSSGTTIATLFICIVSFLFIVGGDEDVICSTCLISGILLVLLSNGYTSKKLEYQNACIEKIERRNRRKQIDTYIPKEPSVFIRILVFVFGFLAIICLFDFDTIGWSFVWAIFWLLCYISYSSDLRRRNDFIEDYRRRY